MIDSDSVTLRHSPPTPLLNVVKSVQGKKIKCNKMAITALEFYCGIGINVRASLPLPTHLDPQVVFTMHSRRAPLMLKSLPLSIGISSPAERIHITSLRRP